MMLIDNRAGGCIQAEQKMVEFGAQERTTPIRSTQWLTQTWDNRSQAFNPSQLHCVHAAMMAQKQLRRMAQSELGTFASDCMDGIMLTSVEMGEKIIRSGGEFPTELWMAALLRGRHPSAPDQLEAGSVNSKGGF